eukprot:5497223-Amphidinium_carterae.2
MPSDTSQDEAPHTLHWLQQGLLGPHQLPALPRPPICAPHPMILDLQELAAPTITAKIYSELARSELAQTRTLTRHLTPGCQKTTTTTSLRRCAVVL